MFSHVMKAHPLERDPIVVISDVARLIRTRADARAREHGMTRAQWMILVRLERQPGMSQNELAALIEVEPITVARLIDRLESRGFVERRHDASDRRIWRLHLAPSATAMLKEIAKARAELNALLMAGVPQKNLDATIDCLLQMKINLGVEPRSSVKSA
jgi:MarR family transcriptional regulator for hemolysin